MKRAISISLALILILSLFTSCKQKAKDNGDGLAQSDFVSTEQNKSFIYDVYKDYTVIKEYIGEDFRVSIPNRLGGKPVKGIGENAIGKSALAIDIVDIPKNVEFIDPSAFFGNGSLSAFTVAGGNDNYKSEKGIIYSKDGKALLHYPVGKTDGEYKVPSGVEEIGEYAFGGSDNVVTVTLPDSCKKIGAHAFEKCTKLVNVNIPEGVEEISDYCFSECRAFPAPKLPSTLKKIGEKAFNYCISFGEIEIPDTVAEIKDSAFYQCETLQKVTLSAALEKYGFKVFSGCKLLDGITVSAKNQFFKDIEGVMYSKDEKTLVDYPYGRYIKDVKFSDSVRNVRAYSFFRDYDGTGEDNFDNIETIKFNKVEKIGAYAFANRNAIKEVNLPSTLKEFSSTAFNFCEKIEKYTIKDCDAYTVQDGVLFTKDKKTIVAYPTNREKHTYKIPDGTENLGDYAFSYCMSLHEIELPDSLVTLGDYCFYMTGTLVGALNFGEKLKSIGKYCFSNCAGIEEITFTDNTITEIPAGAFKILDGTYEFIIPEGVTKIGEDAFRETAYITYVKVPSTVKEIDKRAFYDMDDLHDLTIPAGVETIGEEIVTIMDESNPDKVTLSVFEGSAGEQYAIDNNIPYKVVS